MHDLKTNLLSVGQLQKKGYIITIRMVRVRYPVKGGIVVIQMNAHMLFPLKLETVEAYVTAHKDDSSWIWHYHYGH